MSRPSNGSIGDAAQRRAQLRGGGSLPVVQNAYAPSEPKPREPRLPVARVEKPTLPPPNPTVATLRAPRKRCAFCEVNETSATLADGTPICWRPCYAAQSVIQHMESTAAITWALRGIKDGGHLSDAMYAAGFDADATGRRLIEAFCWPYMVRRRA